MTEDTQLRQLAALTDADYRQKEQAFKNIVMEENAIRADLARLDERQRETREAASDLQMKSLGADILWQSWIGQRKAELNMKLARVLAQKEQHVGVVRKAFGRREVAQQMLVDVEHQKKRANDKRRLEQAIDFSIWGKPPL